MGSFDVFSYGAIGNGINDDSKALQSAIDACSEIGGGRVVIPFGKTLNVCNVQLKSNVNLHLELGSKIVANTDISKYESDDNGLYYILFAENEKNISITGQGMIDGRGATFVDEEIDDIYKVNSIVRPYTICFSKCENVNVSEIKIVDSANWTIWTRECSDVSINDVSIKNDIKMPDSCGVVIDKCQFVKARNCNIISGDNCISILSTNHAMSNQKCENIMINSCCLQASSSAICIGRDILTDVRNVIVDGCTVIDSHRGFAIHVSKGSNVENCIFANSIIETRYYGISRLGAAEPIYISIRPATKDDTVGVVRNIKFLNIICKSENGVFIYGDTKKSILDVSLDNVSVEIDKWTCEKGGLQDINPCSEDESVFYNGKYNYNTSGFFVSNATDIRFYNCKCAWGKNIQKYFAYAIETKDVDELDIKNFSGKGAQFGFDDMKIKNNLENAVFNKYKGKAIRKIPNWAVKHGQINHKIIRAFLQLESENGKVTFDELQERCSDNINHPDVYIKTFYNNFQQMKTDTAVTHGKVFEVKFGEVRIWDFVRPTIMQYKGYFIRDYEMI